MIDDTARRAALARRVHQMVERYVRGRTESRTGIEFETLPVVEENGRRRRLYPERWREAQPKVAQEAFLQMRARRQQQDFVEYFAGTICSVGQFLPRSEYPVLAEALLAQGDEWEDIRALAMIAISTMVNVS
jgi:CRISPR-associated protein Cmx8